MIPEKVAKIREALKYLVVTAASIPEGEFQKNIDALTLAVAHMIVDVHEALKEKEKK